MFRNSRNARRLGFEALEGRQLMAADIALEIVDGDLEITGYYKGSDLQITNYYGYYKVEGLNGQTVNGEPFQYIHKSWVDDVNIHLAGVAGDGVDGNLLKISGIDVSGDLNIFMSQGRDVLNISYLTAAGDVNIETYGGDDSVAFGQKTFAAGHFSTIGGDLNIRTGHGYDSTSILGSNTVKDDVFIDIGTVGPVGSAETLKINGLNVGGYGVDYGANDLTIVSTSHVSLDLLNTEVARDFKIEFANTGALLKLNVLEVGRDLLVSTGKEADQITIDNTSVGRDLAIVSDPLTLSQDRNDTIYVMRTTVGRDMYVYTSPASSPANGSKLDWVSLWHVDIGNHLTIATGFGNDTVSLDHVNARSATLDGGDGTADKLTLRDAAFRYWSDVDILNFEDLDFDYAPWTGSRG
jgi:hypothetical protein